MKKYLYTSLFAILFIGLAVGGYIYLASQRVLGNVSNTTSACQTASATTSPNYIQAGRATTTLIHDSYSNTCGVGNASSNPTLSDSIAVRVQITPSSSPLSTLDMNVQYSDNGQDWFWSTPNITGSSTNVFGLGVRQTFGINVGATTTPNMERCISDTTCLNGATTSRNYVIPGYARYTRIIFTAPIGTQPSAFWAEMMGTKQRQP